MGTLIKVRFKLAWQNYQVGDVIQPSGVLRDWLMRNGYVEPVVREESPPAPPAQLPRKRPRAFQP